MSKIEVVLCNAIRTPTETYGGSLKDTPVGALGAAVIGDVLERSGLGPDKAQTPVPSQESTATATS